MYFRKSPTRLQEFKRVTEYESMTQRYSYSLVLYTRNSQSRKDCSARLVPYYDSRSEPVEDSGLVYRGECLAVPHRKEAKSKEQGSGANVTVDFYNS